MRLKLFTFLFTLTLFSNAQNNFFKPDTLTNQLIINSYGGVASTSIPQNFMNKFIFPEFIDKSFKDDASKKLKNYNLFGGELLSDLHLYFKPGSITKNTFWGIGMGNNTEGNLYFPKDLFNLIFYGNKSYAGEEINLKKISFNLLNYSYLDFTLGKISKKNNAVNSYWIDLGLVLGHNYAKFNLPSSSIFSEITGQYVDLKISNGELEITDNLNNNFIKGIGAKINLNYSYSSENTTLLIQAKNIGTIKWNSLLSSNLDTTYRFEGIEVDNLFNMSDSVINETNELDTLIGTIKKNSFALLPIDLNVYYKRKINRLSIDFILRHRLFTNYNPYARIGLYYKIPILTPGITVGYGGYGKTQIGLNTEVNFKSKLRIVLGTNNILGVLAPKTTTSSDAYIGLKWNF